MCARLPLRTTAVSAPYLPAAPVLPSVAPVLPLPVLEFTADGLPKRALPPLVAAPHRRRFQPVSSRFAAPPALRMFPQSSSSDIGPLFAPVLGTYAQRPNVVEPSGLQIVPPPTPAYMGLRQTVSLPLMQMTVSSTMPSFPSVRSSFPMPNLAGPPPLRMQFHAARSQSSKPVTVSFQTMRPVLVTSNSVPPPPPLHLYRQNMSQRSSAPVVQETGSVTSSFQTVIPVFSVSSSVRPAPLRLHLSDTFPRSAASNNFSCFTISSTGPTVVNRVVCLPVRTVPSQKSTYSSCSSSAGSRSRPAKSSAIDVIDVDDDSCSEEPADSDKLAATAVSSTVESGPAQPSVEVVPSLPTAASSSTVHVELSPLQPIIEAVPSSPAANSSSTVHVESDPVQPVIELVPSLPPATSSRTVCVESSPVQPVIEVVPSSPTAASRSPMRVESGPVQSVIEVIPSLPSATGSSSEHVESGPVQVVIEVVPSSPAASSGSATHGRTSAKLALPGSSNHFQLLHAGVDCLHHIFQYLDVYSRLRAAQVCRCWRRVALQQHLVNSDYIFLRKCFSIVVKYCVRHLFCSVLFFSFGQGSNLLWSANALRPSYNRPIALAHGREEVG